FELQEKWALGEMPRLYGRPYVPTLHDYGLVRQIRYPSFDPLHLSQCPFLLELEGCRERVRSHVRECVRNHRVKHGEGRRVGARQARRQDESGVRTMRKIRQV